MRAAPDLSDCFTAILFSLAMAGVFYYTYRFPGRNLLTRGVMAFVRAWTLRSQDPQRVCLQIAVLSLVMMLFSVAVCVVKGGF